MFLIETRIEGKIAILPVNDRLDTVTASEFERSITEATAGDISSLVLNFENLNYISSAGLRVLLVSARIMNNKNGETLICGARGTVKEVLDVSNFSSVFRMLDSVSSACSKVQEVN